MTQQSYFETLPRSGNHPGRERDRFIKLRAREDLRQRKAQEAAARERTKLQLTIASLNKAVSIIESSIAAEIDRSCFKDHKHYLFPITARALIARRDNLNSTIRAFVIRLEG
jgi:hypothetical protein